MLGVAGAPFGLRFHPIGERKRYRIADEREFLAVAWHCTKTSFVKSAPGKAQDVIRIRPVDRMLAIADRHCSRFPNFLEPPPFRQRLSEREMELRLGDRLGAPPAHHRIDLLRRQPQFRKRVRGRPDINRARLRRCAGAASIPPDELARLLVGLRMPLFGFLRIGSADSRAQSRRHHAPVEVFSAGSSQEVRHRWHHVPSLCTEGAASDSSGSVSYGVSTAYSTNGVP